jgi:hypothetical protein
MTLTLLALLAGSIPAHADSSPFDGGWRGTGTWTRGREEGRVSTVDALTIESDETSFRFEECWNYRDRDATPKHTCAEFSYDRQGNGLFHDGKKVGDIFPRKTQIFESNSQVSEQLLLELQPNGQLTYRYVYLNFDGAAEERESRLSLVSSSR